MERNKLVQWLSDSGILSVTEPLNARVLSYVVPVIVFDAMEETLRNREHNKQKHKVQNALCFFQLQVVNQTSVRFDPRSEVNIFFFGGYTPFP